MKKTLILALFLTGCAPKHPARLVIPRECAVVTIASFTKPCEELKDGKILCDGVIIKATCTRVKNGD